MVEPKKRNFVLIFTDHQGIPLIIAVDKKEANFLRMIEDSEKMTTKQLMKKYNKTSYEVGRALEWAKKKKII